MAIPAIKKKPKTGVEEPTGAKERDLAYYKGKKEKLKSDPNEWAAREIHELRGEKAVENQLDGLAVLNQALQKVLAKLAKKGADIKKIRTPEQFKAEVGKSGIVLTLPEAAAVENLGRIANARGPTTEWVKESWKESWKERLEEAANEVTGLKKYINYAKENPGKTALYTAVGVAGIYLSWKLIKWISNDEEAKKTKGWSKKEKIALALAGVAGSYFLGKKAYAEIRKKFHLDEIDEIKKKFESGKELTKEELKKWKKAGGEMGQRAEDKLKELGGKGTKLAKDAEKLTEETDTKFSFSSNLIISAYCRYNDDFSNEKERYKIRQAMAVMANPDNHNTISEIQAIQAEHEGQKKLRHKNSLGTFHESIPEEHIYHATWILADFSKKYKKRFPNIDYSKITVREFFEDNIFNDSVTRVNDVIHDTMSKMAISGGISGIPNWGRVDISSIEHTLGEMGKGFVERTTADLEIDLSHLNEKQREQFREQFAVLALNLYRGPATLDLDATAAMKDIKNLKEFDPEVREAAKRFYTEVQKRFLQPGGIRETAIERFNIEKVAIRGNENIIKDNLTEKISFKRAVNLYSVTKSIDFTKDVATGSSPEQELVFLYTVLACIDSDEKSSYIGEAVNIFLEGDTPDNMPALQAVEPFFKTMGSLAAKETGKRVRDTWNMIAPSLAPRDMEAQMEFLERNKNISTAEFGLLTAREGVGGAIRVPIDLFTPLFHTGITIEKLRECIDNPIKLFPLIVEAGGNIIYSEDEHGNPTGLINLGVHHFVFQPIGTMAATIKTTFEEGTGKGLKVWVMGIAPLAGANALRGWWKARLSSRGWLTLPRFWGTVKGAAKVFAMPLYLPKYIKDISLGTASGVLNLKKATLEYASRPFKAARHAGRWFGDFMLYRTLLKQNLGNLLEDTIRFKEYSGADDMALKNDSFTQNISNRLRNKWAKKYAIRAGERYNYFFNFNDSDVGWLRLDKKGFSMKDVHDALTRLEDFTKNISTPDAKNILRDLEINSKSIRGNTLRTAVFKALEKINKLSEGGLNKTELRALARQINNPKDVSRLAERLKQGANVLEKTNDAKIAIRAVGMEVARSFEDAEGVISKTQRELGSIQKEINKAEKEINRLTKIRKNTPHKWTPKMEARLAELTDLLENRKLAKKVSRQKLLSLKRVLELENEIVKAKKTAPAAVPHLKRELQTAKETAEDAIIASRDIDYDFGKIKAAPVEAPAAAPKTPEVAPIKNIDTELKKTNADLDAAKRNIADAQEEVTALRKTREGKPEGWWQKSGLQKRYQAAVQRVRENTILQDSLIKAKYALERASNTKARLAAAIKKTPDLVAGLREELKVDRELAGKAVAKSKSTLKSLRELGKVFKWGVPTGFAAMSAYEAGSATWDYATHENREYAALRGYDMALYTPAALFDVGLAAEMAGSTNIWAKGAARVAIPLMIITYAGTSMLDVKKRESKTVADWAKYAPGEGIHEFYSSVNYFSFGDALVTGDWLISQIDTLEESERNKLNTMHKIYKSLVAMQNNPELAHKIHNQGISDKEIEKQVDESYSVYHEYYFRNMNPRIAKTDGHAQRYILEAQMFHDVMTARDAAKTRGEVYSVGTGENLLMLYAPGDKSTDRFNIAGGKENPQGQNGRFSPHKIVLAYKTKKLNTLKQNEDQFKNLERMDTAYLARLYVQTSLYLQESGNQNKLRILPNPNNTNEIKERNYAVAKLLSTPALIKDYLEVARGINFNSAITEAGLYKPRMDLNTLLTHLTSFDDPDNKAFFDFEENNLNITPSVYALYKLAEYFGYTGVASEAELKKFFYKSEYRGIYWDGSDWMVKERGHETDDPFGSQITSRMIRRMIDRIKQHPNDVMAHHGDSLVDSTFFELKDTSFDSTFAALTVAKKLEDSLREGDAREYQRTLEETSQHYVEPPTDDFYKDFKEYRTSLETDPEVLKKKYGEIIERIKKRCEWHQLAYEIKDEKTIRLFRTKSREETTLKLENGTWTVGKDYITGCTLLQAVVLGNLKNDVAEYTRGMSAGSKNPFDIEGARTIDTSLLDFKIDGDWIPRINLDMDYNLASGSIVFDRSATGVFSSSYRPWNLTVLNKKEGWLDIYSKMGINVHDVEKVLDSWWHDKD